MSHQAKLLPLVGLRAVAAAWVVAFHYEVPYAGGGFVGVDIFFVLSGYLITTLLMTELAATGRIDILAFIRRRAARLAPALCIVVLAAALATLALPAALREKAWSDLPWVLSYTSNWKRCFIERFGDSPFFNHSWSLSVEEQFYLTWPLVLALLYRKWSARGVVVGSLVMIVGIMWWRLYLLAQGAAHYRLYHGFDTRADQLLIGCALAAALSVGDWRHASLGIARRHPYLPLVVLGLVPLVGVLCPASSMALYSLGLPAIGIASAIVIVGCHVAESPLAWLLSRSALVRLGSISYGIYLWHIPLKSFFLATGLGFEVPQRIACLGLTIAFAAASYLGVERRVLARTRSRATSTADVAIRVSGPRERHRVGELSAARAGA